MAEQKVNDYPALRKVDRGYVVNVDHNEFQRAQARAAQVRKSKALEARVGNLESKLDQILDLLKKG